MSEFPETYLAHAAQAKLDVSQVSGAHFGGPGSVIVYDGPSRCYRAVLPGDQHTISEPEQVVVCGHGDIAQALAVGTAGATIQEITGYLARDIRDHLAAWADTERLAHLAPITATRRAMLRHGFRINRCSRLGRTDAGALMTTDVFVFRETPALTVTVAHTAAADETSTRMGLIDHATEVAVWNGITRTETACARACQINAAAHRYLGH